MDSDNLEVWYSLRQMT